MSRKRPHAGEGPGARAADVESPVCLDEAHGRMTCRWAVSSTNAIARQYHHDEFGVAGADETRLFEALCLCSQQAGLSWRTILNKREAYRRSMSTLEPTKCAALADSHIDALVASTEDVLKHRGKLLAIRNNAKIFLSITDEFGSFQKFIDTHLGPEPIPPRHTLAESSSPRTRCSQSDALAAAMKTRKFAFLGPVTVYAYLQTVGIVNDHHKGCFRAQPEPGDDQERQSGRKRSRRK